VQDGQTPTFARTDDINLAYNQAVSVTNMTIPEDSRLVSKVAAGHNCWLGSNDQCADVMTTWIENWVNSSTASGPSALVDILTPPDSPPALRGSQTFPSDSSAFATVLWGPVLRPYCSGCHSENPTLSPIPIAPLFASNDPAIAYEQAKPKISLDDETAGSIQDAKSRLVLRLSPEGHNCFGNDCDSAALTMLQAIQAFIPNPDPADIDPIINADTASGGASISAVDCQANDGCNLASGGSRDNSTAIALYEFSEGSGRTINDLSTELPQTDYHLTIDDDAVLDEDYRWLDGYGIEFLTEDGYAFLNSPVQDLQTLRDRFVASGTYSIEAWVIPANVTQEISNIVSFSSGPDERNFTLGQDMYNYDFFHRSDNSSLNGEPKLATPDADEVLQSSLQHVVATFDSTGRKLFVNGELTTAVDTEAPTPLDTWNGSYHRLVLGNEFGGGAAANGGRPWKGILRLVALHDSALSHDKIIQNFEAGVGEKYFLVFGVDHINGVPNDTYIVFEFSLFDDFGYLFHSPTFVYLGSDTNFSPAGLQIKGMRIGVNGSLPQDGQAYSRMDVTLGTNYTPENGERLSNVGTIIPVQNGLTADQFFLVFEQIGGASHMFDELPAATPSDNPNIDVPNMGVRIFSEINNTLSEMTGVPTTNGAVNTVYKDYEQQLPTVENIDGFLGSHQMAIAQLALTYCNELVDGTSGNKQTPTEFFPGFDFSLTANDAFDTAAQRNAIITPLLSRAANIDADPSRGNLDNQPEEGQLTGTDPSIQDASEGLRGLLGASLPQSTDPDGDLPTDPVFDGLITHMLNQCSRVSPPYEGESCDSTARTAEIVKATCASAIGSAVMLAQ
jgi:hypothetical protein